MATNTGSRNVDDPSLNSGAPHSAEPLQSPGHTVINIDVPHNIPLNVDTEHDPPVPVPPPLPYTLRTRRRMISIALFWTVFFIDTNVQPLVLYYTLWYLTDLSDNLVFTVTTCTLGGVSVAEYFYRFYQLFRKGSQVRPLNARRSWLDFFHINFTLVWFILAVELIVGTVRKHPPIRLLAMPLPSVMYYFSFVNTSLDILRALGYKAPFRISSTPKGSVMPTALYVYIEDIVAVDGGGGQVYRRALRNRYLASPMFRQMLFEMNCFWTAGAFAFATAATVLVFTLERDAAYAVGWSLPYVWAALWTAITIPWVQSHLRKEKAAWAKLRTNDLSVLGPHPYQDTVSTQNTTPDFGRLAEAMGKGREYFRGSLYNAMPFTKSKRSNSRRNRTSGGSRLVEKEVDLERGPSTDEDASNRAHANNDEKTRNSNGHPEAEQGAANASAPEPEPQQSQQKEQDY